MSVIAPALLCRYHYDPLDRLVLSAQTGQDSVQRFFQKNRLTTHLQGQTQRTLLHADEQLLALQLGQNQTTTYVLLATDQQNSVIMTPKEKASFTPHGQRHPQVNPMNLPGFTGQQADPVTGHYLLGNGYRGFNPILMTFNSPDSLSPFGEGGLNAYAYCMGDSVNRVDSTGHTAAFLKPLLRTLGVMRKAKPVQPDFHLVRETIQHANTLHAALLTPQKPPVLTHRLKLGERKRLANGIYMFDEQNEDGTLALAINAHGAPPMSHRGPRLVTEGKRYISPRMLHEMIEKNNVNLNLYENIHIISCRSATGGEISFAAKIAYLTGKPTKGYRGLVTNANMRAIRSEDNIGAPQIAITNPFDEKDVRSELFNYEPVWFH